jgi:hypothetical protein
MKKYVVNLFALIAALVSANVLHAQATSCDDPSQLRKDTIAELRDLQGNVLVSDKDGVSSAVSGQRVANKSRVTTTSSAGVVVAFDCGCNVTLKENQRVDIELPRGCAALVAAIQAVPVTVALGSAAAVAPAAAAGSTTGLLAVGAVGVGGYALLRRNRNVSPN